MRITEEETEKDIYIYIYSDSDKLVKCTINLVYSLVKCHIKSYAILSLSRFLLFIFSAAESFQL